MIRYRIDLAYKGTHFHGWQIQPNAKTVQGEINNALKIILRKKIETVGSGRTDAGVHASAQVLHFDYEQHIDFDLAHRLNALIPKDIVIYNVQQVDQQFHARFSPISRAYRYQIRSKHSPFLIDQYYHLRTLPDIDRMNEACAIFKNHINYKCFSKTHTDVNTFNCTIFKAEWIKHENGVEFYIQANRFLRGMVRAIVGTLLEIGHHYKEITYLEEVILSENRNIAGQAVPAQGLFLCEVNYPK